MEQVATLSDSELTARLFRMRGDERSLQVKLLWYLAELEHRKLHLLEGYSSLFSYCTKKLGYSESATSRRVRGARVLRRFPQCARLLEKGIINLSTLSQVSGLLEEGNVAEILQGISGKSQREVEALVSSYRPEEKPRERLRPMTVLKRSVAKSEGETKPSLLSESLRNRSERRVNQCVNTPSNEEKKRELRYQLSFSVDADTKAKLSEVQALLSSRLPQGQSLEQLFGVLLDSYMEKHSPKAKEERRRKRAEKKEGKKAEDKKTPKLVQKRGEPKKSEKPGAISAKPKNKRRTLPAALREEVLRRDSYCCTFVGADGRRCDSCWDLEVDHIIPFACGGSDEPENLRLLCRAHNQLAAEFEVDPFRRTRIMVTQRGQRSVYETEKRINSSWRSGGSL